MDKRTIVQVLLVVLLGVVTRGAVADEEYNVVVRLSPLIPYENDLYELKCPRDGTLEYFMLHGKGQAMMPGYVSETISVYDNGSVIFAHISMEHEGTHLCVLNMSDGTMFAHEASVRVRPLASTDLWNDMYESMFWTGMIAALAIATVFGLFCLVSKKRWRSPMQPIPTRAQDKAAIMEEEQCYDNPAMPSNQDDDPDEISIKM